MGFLTYKGYKYLVIFLYNKMKKQNKNKQDILMQNFPDVL